ETLRLWSCFLFFNLFFKFNQMKTNKIKFSLIVFALFIGANLVAQITPANAYGKTSKMVANQDFDAEANATFKFDIEVRGTFKFGSKSDKFLYYLNSA